MIRRRHSREALRKLETKDARMLPMEEERLEAHEQVDVSELCGLGSSCYWIEFFSLVLT